ncbi:hypothetical protein Q9299_04725 [Gemmobacter fulvus]|uniref:hypothetical protein n=1 Tax=Gemmobacter fulvus TaxID=2840474 RepID=UPI002796B40E|nr:hypothetical protein [Gemmobacter fulvus]MDQ1847585.1 hypothetical protein [Gemmobacter fulvus]
MTRTLFALSLGFAGVILATHAGHAATCAPRDALLAKLADHYGERRQALGLADNRMMMELFASDTGSWTMAFTGADGITCLVATGQAYEGIPAPLPAKGDPA